MFKYLLFLILVLGSSVALAGEIEVTVMVDGAVNNNYELVVDSKEVVNGDVVSNGNKTFFVIDKNGVWEDQLDTTIVDGVNSIKINISTKSSIKT